jgi:hypothetical protein
VKNLPFTGKSVPVNYWYTNTIFEGGKEIIQVKFFSTFEYPFLPWTIFFSGAR